MPTAECIVQKISKHEHGVLERAGCPQKHCHAVEDQKIYAGHDSSGSNSRVQCSTETHLDGGAAAGVRALLLQRHAQVPAAQDVPGDFRAVAAIGPAQAHRPAPADGCVQQQLGGRSNCAGIWRDAQRHLRILQQQVIMLSSGHSPERLKPGTGSKMQKLKTTLECAC